MFGGSSAELVSRIGSLLMPLALMECCGVDRAASGLFQGAQISFSVLA